MVDNSSIPDSNFMQNMLELGNNVLKVQENYNLIIEQNKSLEKEIKKCMDKLEVDNDKNLTNIQNSFDQKFNLFQKEITNKLEQKYKENYQSLELKIQEIEEENTEKITNLKQMISDLEKIIKQKDEKINSLDGEIKQKISEIERDHYKDLLDIQDKSGQKVEQIQNEIKQIKTENEAYIKTIKQKNKEKYQQLETENKNKIENLKEIIKEKEVKITSLEGDITRKDAAIIVPEIGGTINIDENLQDKKTEEDIMDDTNEKILEIVLGSDDGDDEDAEHKPLDWLAEMEKKDEDIKEQMNEDKKEPENPFIEPKCVNPEKPLNIPIIKRRSMPLIEYLCQLHTTGNYFAFAN
uniref:Uncharacterized protein n=1 Tax=Meloidogyne floridensis TaxID=298350 RepID=A0A915P148_9BILA